MNKNLKILIGILAVAAVAVVGSLAIFEKAEPLQSQPEETQQQAVETDPSIRLTFYHPLTNKQETMEVTKHGNCVMKGNDSSICYVGFTLMTDSEKQDMTSTQVLPADEGMYTFSLEDIQTKSGLNGQRFIQKYADTEKYGNTLLKEYYFFTTPSGNILGAQPSAAAGVNPNSQDRKVADEIINSMTF